MAGAKFKSGGKAESQAESRKSPQQILDEVGVEKICEWIAEGVSYREIARRLDMTLGSLTWWMEANQERSHACACARELAAQSFDEIALEGIEKAADPFELSKAKEMAVHYRWRAKSANPKRYGDRQQLDVKAEVNTLYDLDQAKKMIAWLKTDDA